MHPKKCAECGSTVVVSYAPVPFDVRGEAVHVGGVQHGLCSGCGEVYLSIDAAEQLQSAAINKSKAAKQLMSPQEIRDLRHSLGLSQAAFEELLGIGAKSVVRWEKGTVFQSATADRLMRLIRLMPELSGVLTSGKLYASEPDGVALDLSELQGVMASLPHLSAEEAAEFASGIDTAREELARREAVEQRRS